MHWPRHALSELFLCHTLAFSASGFFKAYEDEFVEGNAKQSLLKPKHEGVIPEDVKTAIEGANGEDAKCTKLEYLQKCATLRVDCDVVMAAKGYPGMQALGKRMKEALPPEGW